MEQPTAAIQVTLSPRAICRIRKLVTREIHRCTSELELLIARYNYALSYLDHARANHQINDTVFRAAEAEYKREGGSLVEFYDYSQGRPLLALLVRKWGETGWAVKKTEERLGSTSKAIKIVRKDADRLKTILEDLKGGTVVPGVVEEAETEVSGEGLPSAEGEKMVEALEKMFVDNVEPAGEKQLVEEEAKVAVEAEVIEKQPTEKEAEIAVEAPAELEAKAVEKQPTVEDEDASWSLV
ncbi:uncharacterized protein LAJ45_10545 [Morchella importuna]|uniref:uncharacterized protein n=1 Tax=Morchella importuna TaxID=1174673 RepID=UPI001E8CF5BB|nr:uncharacterized protein LAJ45_10545 [Morchella importuna]KAH8145423.1 hypothetical protein LAJ45_10545 [Morchella importuna]